jgi:hypothetical protein
VNLNLIRNIFISFVRILLAVAIYAVVTTFCIFARTSCNCFINTTNVVDWSCCCISVDNAFFIIGHGASIVRFLDQPLYHGSACALPTIEHPSKIALRLHYIASSTKRFRHEHAF